jgi:hypothetical protein
MPSERARDVASFIIPFLNCIPQYVRGLFTKGDFSWQVKFLTAKLRAIASYFWSDL